MKKKMAYSVLRTIRGTILVTVINKSQLTDLKTIFLVLHQKLLEHIINLYNTKSTLL